MSAQAPDEPVAVAPPASRTPWPVMAIAAAVVGVATWLWLRDPAAPTDNPESTTTPATQPSIPLPTQSVSAGPASLPTSRPRAGSTTSGKLHLELPSPGSGTLTSLDMTVGGGVAVWEPREHRLRVLLVDEPLTPSAERQMLDYLQSERLADSGRARAVLEMHFRSNAKTFDRDGLETASLTLTNPDGTVSGTTDVLGSLKWSGNMPGPPAAGAPTEANPTTLEMSAAGNGASPASPAGHDSWQLSVAIPVTQAR